MNESTIACTRPLVALHMLFLFPLAGVAAESACAAREIELHQASDLTAPVAAPAALLSWELNGYELLMGSETVLQVLVALREEWADKRLDVDEIARFEKHLAQLAGSGTPVAIDKLVPDAGTWRSWQHGDPAIRTVLATNLFSVALAREQVEIVRKESGRHIVAYRAIEYSADDPPELIKGLKFVDANGVTILDTCSVSSN